MQNITPINLFLKTGLEAKKHRESLGLNQLQFWGRISVSQSAASRYECGRSLPLSIQQLLHVAYADRKAVTALVRQLRQADFSVAEHP